MEQSIARVSKRRAVRGGSFVDAVVVRTGEREGSRSRVDVADGRSVALARVVDAANRRGAR